MENQTEILEALQLKALNTLKTEFAGLIEKSVSEAMYSSVNYLSKEELLNEKVPYLLYNNILTKFTHWLQTSVNP
jgi:hypothetical protein